MAEDDALFADELVDAPEPEAPVEDAPAESVAQPEPEAAPAPTPAPEPQPQRPDAGFVPIAAMMDERDKRRQLEAELAQYRASQQPQAPDPFDDPAGFAAAQQQLVQQAIIEDRFARSNEDAVDKFGEDTVKAAIEWAGERGKSNPAFAAEYMTKPRPIHWIVQQHKRDAMLSEVGDNVDDWFTREAAKRGYAPPSAPAAATPVVIPQQALPPVKVPRSLATQGSGSSDVRDVAAGALAAVDAVFPQ